MLGCIALFLLLVASGAYNVVLMSSSGIKSSICAPQSIGKRTTLFVSKPQFGSDRHYPGQEVYAPTRIYGFSWKLKNFILSSAMLVTFPIRLLFSIVSRGFRAVLSPKPKKVSENAGTAPGDELESSMTEKTNIVVAALAKENEEAGKVLMEKSPFSSVSEKKAMEEAQWKEKLRKANAAATASEERQRQEAIQLAINLGYRSNSTSTTVVEDEDVAENFDVSSIFTWKSLNSGDTVLRDHLKVSVE